MNKPPQSRSPWLCAGAAAAVLALTALKRYRRLANVPALSAQSRQSGVRGEYVQAGPWRMYTRMVGDIDAPVVVLIHGLIISSRYMEPLALALAANGYRVLAPDLPGYGESVHGSPQRALSMKCLSDALFRWAKAAGVQRACFIGNSFGCQVLTMLAVEHPSVVDRLVLQGPTVDPHARNLLAQIGRAIVNGRRERNRSSAALGRVDYAKAGPLRVITSMKRLISDRMELRLPLVHVPCLVVAGSRDTVAPLAWAKLACELLPDARLIVIEGATHTMNYVYPFSFAQAVKAFLQAQSQGLEVKR